MQPEFPLYIYYNDSLNGDALVIYNNDELFTVLEWFDSDEDGKVLDKNGHPVHLKIKPWWKEAIISFIE